MLELWIRVAANVSRNDKVLALALTLYGDSPLRDSATLGNLVALWGAVAEHRPSGDLSGVLDSTLERWAEWRGEPGGFAGHFRAAFMEDGMLDGWRERQGALIDHAARERARKRKARTPAGDAPPAANATAERLAAEPAGTVRGPSAEVRDMDPPVTRDEFPTFAQWQLDHDPDSALTNGFLMGIPTRSERRSALALASMALESGLTGEALKVAVSDWLVKKPLYGPRLWREYLRNAKREDDRLRNGTALTPAVRADGGVNKALVTEWEMEAAECFNRLKKAISHSSTGVATFARMDEATKADMTDVERRAFDAIGGVPALDDSNDFTKRDFLKFYVAAKTAEAKASVARPRLGAGA